jgi:uncharacterized protein YbjT (DUF2867 family)
VTVLVVGATGKSGKHVVDHLLKKGADVRAMSRNAAAQLPEGVELFVGDTANLSSMEAAFQDVTAVHLPVSGGSTSGSTFDGARLVAAAEAAGVKRATLLWNGVPGDVERAFEQSDIEWTRLESATFMGNTLVWAPAIREGEPIEAAFVDAPETLIDEYDVGEIAANVLTEGGHAGEVLTPTGDEPITTRRRVEFLSTELGRNVPLVELSEEAFRQNLNQAGYDDALVELLVAWQKRPVEEAARVSPAVSDVLGRPARRFIDWTAANIDAFR